MERHTLSKKHACQSRLFFALNTVQPTCLPVGCLPKSKGSVPNHHDHATPVKYSPMVTPLCKRMPTPVTPVMCTSNAALLPQTDESSAPEPRAPASPDSPDSALTCSFSRPPASLPSSNPCA